MSRQPLLLASTMMVAASCGLLAPLSEPIDVERSIAECADGVDNDLDGREDCDDPSCGCDACGTGHRIRTTGDLLGVECNRSCECRQVALPANDEPNLQVCNRSPWLAADRGRCLPVTALDESGEATAPDNGFAVDFILEHADDGSSRPGSQRQNVVGVVRFQGQTFRLSAAVWSRDAVAFCEGACATGDFALEVLLAKPLIVQTPSTTVSIDDGLGADTSGVALRSQLGPATFMDRPGLNQIAVIQSSRLTVAWLDESAHLVNGRFTGRLRPSGAVDRANSGTCRPALSHPDLQACFPPPRRSANALFLFGCILDRSAPARSGRMIYAWNHPWSAPDLTIVHAQGGRCAAARTAEGLEVRLAVGLQDNPAAMLQLSISNSVLAPGTTVPIGEASNLRVRVYRVETSGLPLFSVPTDGVNTASMAVGRLGIEQVNAGDPARFFGWLEGMIAP